MRLRSNPQKVLVPKGSQVVYKFVNADEMESITILFTYSAAPPMVLCWYKEDVPKKILENIPSDWGVGCSELGWMTVETFYEYITNVFYPWLLKENIEFPVLLYLWFNSVMNIILN